MKKQTREILNKHNEEIETPIDIEQKVEKMIVCQNCGKKAESCFPEDEDGFQGYGIASLSHKNEEITEDYIISCCFGSSYDNSIYKWKNKPSIKGNVCDDCIDTLKKEGEIELYDNYMDSFVDLYDEMPKIFDQTSGELKIKDIHGNELPSPHMWGPWDDGILEKVKKDELHPTSDWLFMYMIESNHLNNEIRSAIENHLASCEECLKELQEQIKYQESDEKKDCGCSSCKI